MVTTIPTRLAATQIAALRGKPKAALDLAVADNRHRGCAAAGVRLTGPTISNVCRLDLYAAWRLLTAFETPKPVHSPACRRAHAIREPVSAAVQRSGITEPDEPRTKPTCCDPEGQPPIDPDLIARFEQDARRLARGLSRSAGRAQVVQEAGGWAVFIPGLPIAADGATFGEAITELVEALREYAQDWQDRLLHAPKHRENRGLVQLISLSDDEQLREWLVGPGR